MDARLKNLFDNVRLKGASQNPTVKDSDLRDEFERDMGRVMFSSAARRLHDKTQVMPLTMDDNIHSRLTHSIETMNIGASLAKDICFNETFMQKFALSYQDKEFFDMYDSMRAILQTACLVHDIGNPPFGHFGELAIRDYFTNFFKSHKNVLDTYDTWSIDFTQYDGNAQGFRALTKLQLMDNLYGLNLTRSTLAAYIKYPNANSADNKCSSISQHKHGIFKADEAYLKIVAYKNTTNKQDTFYRHPFTYLVEAADSICYLTMDIEDAFKKKWVTLEQIKEDWDKFKVAVKKDKNNIKFNPTATIEGIFSNLVNKDSLDRRKMLDLRVKLIKYLVDLAVNNYVNNIEDILAGRYNLELIEDDTINMVAKFLRKICKKYIFSQQEIQSIELTGWSVINGLLDIYIKLFMGSNEMYQLHGEKMISKSILKANKLDYLIHTNKIVWQKDHYIDPDSKQLIKNIDTVCDQIHISSLPNYYRFRIIVDFISGMTDKFAVKHYQKLSGQRI